MGVAIPLRTTDVDAAWLTAALVEGGVLVDAEITSLDIEPVGVGIGLLGELARARPLYAGDEPGAPATVIIKLPSLHEANRAQGMAFGFYEREIRFYRDVAPGLALRVPRCYWSAMDLDAGRFGLLLEDFASLQMADQVAGVSPARATLAVEHLARFHAQWWETAALDALDWMPLSNGPVTMQAVGVYERGWPLFLDHFGGGLPAEARIVGERVRDNFAWLLDGLGARPRTIVHTDFRLDNLFFGDPGPDDELGDEFGVIDWQLSTRGRGVYDVAYLLGQSMAVEVRRDTEMDLLRRWHETLCGAGVDGYSFDEALDDYRRSTMICLVIAVAAGADLDLGNDRGRALVQALTDRAFAAVLDLDAASLLPPAPPPPAPPPPTPPPTHLAEGR